VSVGREWFRRVWNELDTGAIDQLLAPDGVVHGFGAAPIRGPHGLHQFHRNFTDAFRSIRFEILHELQNGDLTALYLRATLTPRRGAQPLAFEGASFFRVGDGRILEAWNTWDFLGLVQGLGALPPDALTLAMAGRLRPAG